MNLEIDADDFDDEYENEDYDEEDDDLENEFGNWRPG
jgi:hypothetical protein